MEHTGEPSSIMLAKKKKPSSIIHSTSQLNKSGIKIKAKTIKILKMKHIKKTKSSKQNN